MEQDLFGWLNSQRNSHDTGLLVAPLTNKQQESNVPLPEEFSPSQDEHTDSESTPETQAFIPEPEHSDSESLTENHHDIHEPELNDSESTSETQTLIPESDSSESEQADTESQSSSGTFTNETEYANYVPLEPDSYIPEEYMPSSQPENEYENPDPALQNHEWQERATGFTLSLDEPPPELWTHINDDDPDPDYEPTDSLQGAAYVQIHGRNFTERLHHTLKHRKERSQERAQAENDNSTLKSLMQFSVILCGTLVMALGFALLSLWFIGRETPEGMKRRAEALTEAGKFSEASEIYRRAHRRYPNNPEFLAGLSESSQKAGHVQTAKTAHEEYIRLTSEDAPKTNEITPIAQKPEPDTAPKSAHMSLILNEQPLTFSDYLDEANHAYNVGMYSRAVINFFRAIEINANDSRPYIGLAASYRMKGMYFDSKRILDEARRKFGRSPALDMETYFLREAK